MGVHLRKTLLGVSDLQPGDSVCQFSPLRVSKGIRLATEGAGREVQTDIFRDGQHGGVLSGRAKGPLSLSDLWTSMRK